MNDSEPNFHAPFSFTYTSVTIKEFVTSLPPTTASSRILFNTIAVEPMTRADASKWEFSENGRNFSVSVPARVLSTDATLNRRLAIAGLGITMAYEGHVRAAFADGQLVSLLADFCAPFPGYYLYYPQRPSASRALRAFVEHVRRRRRSGRGNKRSR